MSKENEKPTEPNPMPTREPRPLPQHDEDDLRQIMKDVDKRYEK